MDIYTAGICFESHNGGREIFFTALLFLGIAFGTNSQEVILLTNTDILGPVKTVTSEDIAANNFSDSETMGTIQTTSYDRTGKMLKNKIQYYEGSSETSYDYIGNCVRRIYSSRGYSEVSELIDVHFPDQNCNDSQIINYGDGKVIGRTVLSMSGNILTEKTFRQNNTVSSTKTTICSPGKSECSRNEISDGSHISEKWTIWPNGKIKFHTVKEEYGNGNSIENIYQFNEKGRVIDSIYRYNNSSSNIGQPYVRHNTYRYVKDDIYGNWKSRQVFRIIQKFNKSSEILEMTTNRVFNYF